MNWGAVALIAVVLWLGGVQLFGLRKPRRELLDPRCEFGECDTDSTTVWHGRHVCLLHRNALARMDEATEAQRLSDLGDYAEDRHDAGNSIT